MQQPNPLSELATPKITYLEGDEIDKQNKLMSALSDYIETRHLADNDVFRLGTIKLKKEGNKFDLSFCEARVVPAGVTNFFSYSEMPQDAQQAIAENVYTTLSKSGQATYILENWDDLTQGGWSIAIDVDFYYKRPTNATGFHKDTIGYSLFVNLNFNNTAPMMGPEYILNPPQVPDHNLHISNKLPQAFLNQLDVERQRLGEPSIIEATKLERPYGIVSFVDELVHHSTPYLQHRGIPRNELDVFFSTIPPYKTAYEDTKIMFLLDDLYRSSQPFFNRQELISHGLPIGMVNFLFENNQNVFTTISREKIKEKLESVNYDRLGYILSSPHMEQMNFLKSKEFFGREDLERFGIPDDQGSQLLQGRDLDFVNLAHCEHDCAINTHAMINPIMAKGKPRLQRRMSAELDGGSVYFSDPQVKRQFMRTWVQAYPPGI